MSATTWHDYVASRSTLLAHGARGDDVRPATELPAADDPLPVDRAWDIVTLLADASASFERRIDAPPGIAHRVARAARRLRRR